MTLYDIARDNRLRAERAEAELRAAESRIAGLEKFVRAEYPADHSLAEIVRIWGGEVDLTDEEVAALGSSEAATGGESCPECGGHGMIPTGVNRDFDTGMLEADDEKPCPTCGTGQQPSTQTSSRPAGRGRT